MAVSRRFGLSRPKRLGCDLAGARPTAPSLLLLLGASRGRARAFRRRGCRSLLYRQSEQTPTAVDGLIQHLEIDLHRLTREVALEMQHPLLLVEPRGLGQLRGDDTGGRKVDALRGEIREGLREARGGVGIAEARRGHVPQHREVPGLERIVERAESGAEQEHNLLGIGHHHLRLGRCGTFELRAFARPVSARRVWSWGPVSAWAGLAQVRRPCRTAEARKLLRRRLIACGHYREGRGALHQSNSPPPPFLPRTRRAALPADPNADPAAGEVFIEPPGHAAVQLHVLGEPHRAVHGKPVLALECAPIAHQGEPLALRKFRHASHGEGHGHARERLVGAPAQRIETRIDGVQIPLGGEVRKVPLRDETELGESVGGEIAAYVGGHDMARRPLHGLARARRDAGHGVGVARRAECLLIGLGGGCAGAERRRIGMAGAHDRARAIGAAIVGEHLGALPDRHVARTDGTRAGADGDGIAARRRALSDRHIGGAGAGCIRLVAHGDIGAVGAAGVGEFAGRDVAAGTPLALALSPVATLLLVAPLALALSPVATLLLVSPLALASSPAATLLLYCRWHWNFRRLRCYGCRRRAGARCGAGHALPRADAGA